MADRVFAGITLALVLAYAVVAFAFIEAPFQYDPLGPESWPRLLAIAAALCCAVLIWRPVEQAFDADAATLARLGLTVAMLVLYAAMFEPLGFVISTALYGTAMTRFLGGKLAHAAAFGVATGVIGYLLCTVLLELNLPAGLLPDLS
ncbi:MAG: tripartite tricarboxylate transporter TctB family protein [Paracoccaceae bacterium]